MKNNTIICLLAFTGLTFISSCADMDDEDRPLSTTTTTTTEETTLNTPLTRTPLSTTTVETQTTRSN